MASSFLGIGVSGLRVAQQQLNTTSHNISNVNTEGYSRQETLGTTRIPQASGGAFIGTGSIVQQTRRIFDETLIDNHRENISAFNQQEIFSERSGRIDNLLSDPENGLTAMMNRFYNAINDMALNPMLDGPRQVVLSSSTSLVSQFNQLNGELNKEASLINKTFESITLEISSLAASISELNQAIVSAVGSSEGATPNDLLDQRDKAIDQLSEYVSTNVIEDSDGSFNVYIGNGQPLVIGGTAATLTTQVSTNDPLKVDIVFQTSAASIAITETLTGGKIQGLFDYQENVLFSAFNQVGKIAIGLSEAFNSQHSLGMDLNDNVGGQFFNDMNGATIVDNRVVESANNTGTANMGATVTDVSSIIDSDYRLSFDGANYTVFREFDNQTLGPFGTLPITIDGFSIDIVNGGTPAAGDEFLVMPTRRGGEEIALVVDTTDEIAAALPIEDTASNSNIGTGVVKSITMIDTTTAAFTTTAGALTPPIRVQISEPTPGNFEYEIYDMTTPATPVLVDGPRVFTPGQDNTILAPGGLDATYGYEITLSGNPEAGDTFDFTYNNGGYGDNRNALALADLERTKLLDGNRSSLSESFARLTSDVGSQTHEAKISGEVAKGLLIQSNNAKLSVSGVNLDEEAANLIRYQQAYQASAQIISVAGVVFDALIQSVR